MTTSLVHKAALLGKIIKLIPDIAVKLDSIEARLGRMEETGISEPRGRIEKSSMPEPQTFESLAKQNSLALSLTPAQIEYVKDELVELIKQNPSQLARIDAVRRALALARFNGCADKLRRICSGDPDKVHAGSIDHNLAELSNSKFIMVERPSRLLFPLLAIDRVYLNRANLKVLIIGPRTEMENIQYVAYGFDPKNVRSIDLFSYSDTIDVGDMHSMPYADHEFDIVVSGWVISYSDENKVAAAEMLRICKPSGLIALALDYQSCIRYTENGQRVEKNVDSTTAILELFGDRCGKVIFANDPDPTFPVSPVREPSANIVVFEKN